MGLINIIKGTRKRINNNRFGHWVNSSKFGQNLEEKGLRKAINNFSILGRVNNSASGQFVEYMFASSSSLDFNVTRYILKGAGVAALAVGCSSKDDDDRDLLGPSIGNETVLSGAYEGSTVNIDVDVSDPSGISSVKVLYRLSSSADAWTEAAQLTLSSGDTYSGSFVMPVSDSYDFFIEGNDSLGNVSSTLEQTVDSWANETNAETEIIAKLAEFKANGDIDDYWGPDYTFPLADTTTITVDASVIDLSSAAPIKAISYKGESDTDLTAYLNEISRLNADPIPVTDIREMIRSRLPTEMDDAELNDWPNNVYVERPDYFKQGLKTAGKAVLASAPVALGIGLYALIAGEEKAKELGKKVGRFFRSVAPVLAAPVAVAGSIGLAPNYAHAEDIEERIENSKKIKTVYNKHKEVARIEETTEDKSKYKTDIYKLDWHTAEPRLVGVEEGMIQNNQNIRLTTRYFNIEKGGKNYTIIADHVAKTVEFNKSA